MIKSWKEMREIDVSPYIEQRDGNDYLPWARCVELLHENGAEKVYFEPLTTATGSSLFMSDKEFSDKNGRINRCYEVRVKITIDDLEFVMNYPLLSGSTPIRDDILTQQRVYTAQARCFVKGVAIFTGLGFGLWLSDIDTKETEQDLSKHNLFSIKERFQQEYTTALRNKGMSTADIATACDMTEEEVKTIFTYFDQLNRFEQKLMKL